MKNYLCLVLCISHLQAMQKPPQSSSISPSSSGAIIKYSREKLLALNQSHLSRSMDSAITAAEIKASASQTKMKSHKSSSTSALPGSAPH